MTKERLGGDYQNSRKHLIQNFQERRRRTQNIRTDAMYLPQEFTSSNVLKGKCCKKYSPRQIISPYSSSQKQFVTFTLAPVDVRHCRLRLPVQFSRENGISKAGKIYLVGKDGSKWLANLLLESRGRMTLGDGWKSFVKANGLKTGESYTLKFNWEDTTPVLRLCSAEYGIDKRAGGGCSEANEKESFPVEPRSGHEMVEDRNTKDDNIFVNGKEETSSCERIKNHLRWRDSTSPSQNRFVTLAITPDSLRHGRLRLPLQFMMENSLNKPREITLLGKDGARCLVSLLLEKRGRMSLGKGWKDFAKANSLQTGDSITLELIWEIENPVLSLLRIESSRAQGQQVECSKTREKGFVFTEPSSGDITRKAENNREDSRKYSPVRSNSSLATQNRFPSHSPEINRTVTRDFRIGEFVVFRREGDRMLQASDLGPSCCEIREVLAPSSKNDQENIGSISMKIEPDLRKEADLSLHDSDVQDNVELPRKKKVKKNNPGAEQDSISGHSCFVDNVTASTLQTDGLYLPNYFTSSNGVKRKCSAKYTPGQMISSYSSSEKHFVTFTLAPVDVRNCRLRLPMQFTRENGINKPGKIYLLGNDGSKWLANLLLESRGRMTLGDGWKSFVKANHLKTGESFTLMLDWEDTTPVLSLCPAEYSIDRKVGGECSEASENESLPVEAVEPSNGKKNSKDKNSTEENNTEENRNEESGEWERERNHVSRRGSTLPSQNRFVTITITPDSLRHGRLRLPLQFMRENSMNKPGEITLLGKDGAKWQVSLLLERRGRMTLGKGWKDFANANGLKTGDSITLESIWETASPVLSLLHVESSYDRGQCEFSEEFPSTEPSCGFKTRKVENNREASSSGEQEKINYLPRSVDSSSAIQNRLVTLTLTPEDVRDCTLHLPSQFMRVNCINTLGKITLLGKSGMKWFGYLLSRDGTVALGNDWGVFCEANGMKLGESFTLEFIPKEGTNPVFQLQISHT